MPEHAALSFVYYKKNVQNFFCVLIVYIVEITVGVGRGCSQHSVVQYK